VRAWQGQEGRGPDARVAPLWLLLVRRAARGRRAPLRPCRKGPRRCTRGAHQPPRAARGRPTPRSCPGPRGHGRRRALDRRARGRRPQAEDARRVPRSPGHVERFFGNVRIDLVRPEDIEEWRTELARERSAHTVNLIAGTLRAALRRAQREGILEVVPEPSRAISPMRRRGAPERLSPAQAEAVVEALGAPLEEGARKRRTDGWQDAGELILLTGLRIGEVLALRPEAVHLDAKPPHLQVLDTRRSARRTAGSPKTEHAERAILLSPRAVELLRGRLEGTAPGAFLWPGAQDGAPALV
jgi:integrase